jgi:hypothetical protein
VGFSVELYKEIIMRIKITSEQYNKILIHEQGLRPKTNLNENVREVMFGTALLMGIKLSGLNKEVGEKALSDAKAMREIKDTLNDENKFKDLMKSLEEKGMANAETHVTDKISEIVKNYNKKAMDNGFEDRLGVDTMIKFAEEN